MKLNASRSRVSTRSAKMAAQWLSAVITASGVSVKKEASDDHPNPCIFIGAPGADRTRDTQLRRLVLYPLSYGRITAARLMELSMQVKA